jgi:ABC-type nitrate/sulfonate/bicarbonate transport system permease component
MTLFLGATARMEITVIAIGAVWPVLVQTVDGCRAVAPAVGEMTRVFRIGWRQRWLFVVLPGTAPYAATAIRVAASLSLLLAVGVEVLGGVPGVGQQIAQAQQNGATALAFGYVLYAGVIGMTLSAILARIERRLLRWHTASRVAA